MKANFVFVTPNTNDSSLFARKFRAEHVHGSEIVWFFVNFPKKPMRDHMLSDTERNQIGLFVRATSVFRNDVMEMSFFDMFDFAPAFNETFVGFGV